MATPLTITLIEEVSPGDVIAAEDAEKKLWNAPPPVEARYRLAGGDKSKNYDGTWDRLKKQYWDEDILEEFDMFFALPGWRLFKDAPDNLRVAGYDVRILTLEEQEKQAEERKREQKR